MSGRDNPFDPLESKSAVPSVDYTEDFVVQAADEVRAPNTVIGCLALAAVLLGGAYLLLSVLVAWVISNDLGVADATE